MINYYQESGQINQWRGIVSLLAILVATTFLSYWYVVIYTLIPLVYFIAAITIGFSFLLGYLVDLFPYTGQIRNKRVRISVAVLVSLVAYYAQWIAFIVHISSQKQVFFQEYISALTGGISLKGLVNTVIFLNQFGTWELPFLSRQLHIEHGDTVMVSGWFLSIVWLLEALIIFAIPIKKALSFIPRPFSEDQRKFYDKFVIDQHFRAVHSATGIVEALTENARDTLSEMGEGSARLYSKAIIYHLPLENYSYLSIDKITTNGSRSSSSRIIKSLRISNQDAARILSAFQHKKSI